MDLRASIETIEDKDQQHMQQNLQPLQQRPVYAAPSLMSVRSCFVYPSRVQHFHQYAQSQHQYAQSQPQLSQSYSNPYIARMSNSADHLVSSSLNQLHSSPICLADQQLTSADMIDTLPFHEQVKNSAAHLVSGQKVTVVPDSDVNVIGTAVRIQVCVE